jgi:hypothetical protein
MTICHFCQKKFRVIGIGGDAGQHDWVECAYNEIARLRARPTEEEVARQIHSIVKDGSWHHSQMAARAVLALFPKVQP